MLDHEISSISLVVRMFQPSYWNSGRRPWWSIWRWNFRGNRCSSASISLNQESEWTDTCMSERNEVIFFHLGREHACSLGIYLYFTVKLLLSVWRGMRFILLGNCWSYGVWAFCCAAYNNVKHLLMEILFESLDLGHQHAGSDTLLCPLSVRIIVRVYTC
jgi:hypothetical protein